MDAVHAPHRAEAHRHHDRVLHVPTVLRVLRAAILLGGRAPGLPRAVGRHHRYHVLVHFPRSGEPGVLPAARRAPQDAHGYLQHRHGHLAQRHCRIHVEVQKRRRPAVRRAADRCVRRVHVLHHDGHAAVAVDPMRRSVSDGRQRYFPNFSFLFSNVFQMVLKEGSKWRKLNLTQRDENV